MITNNKSDSRKGKSSNSPAVTNILKKVKDKETDSTIMDKRLWGRIGMSIPCTNEEYTQFKNLLEEDEYKAADFLYELISKNGFFNGGSYLPADVEDNPNKDDFEF